MGICDSPEADEELVAGEGGACLGFWISLLLRVWTF